MSTGKLTFSRAGLYVVAACLVLAAAGRPRSAPRLARAGAAASDFTPYLVKDIHATASAWPGHLTVLGDFVYFVADDGEHGYELWRSEGTAAGTPLVKKSPWVRPAHRPTARHAPPTRSTSAPPTANKGMNGGEAMGPHPARCWSRISIPAPLTVRPA